MWKAYSKSYLKGNPVSARSIRIAVFMATLFLSLLIYMGYNLWKYEIERIEQEEGDWQGRIVGQISEEELAKIQNFAQVKKATLHSSKDGQEKSIDLVFKDPKTIYTDLPWIVDQIHNDTISIQYHDLLLADYFIHDPDDPQPPLLLGFGLFLFLIVIGSLILIIRNAFEISQQARIHQFGILSSIGATPKQIRTVLIQEALALSTLPIFLGSLMGLLGSYGLIALINFYAKDVAGRHKAIFSCPIPLFGLTILLAFGTVLFSAWIPARKLSKMSPLEAIKNRHPLALKKKSHSWILAKLFGIEGEIAGQALKSQKKALRLSSLSLLLSFFSFSLMLCFTTLSNISTQFTYFERYQEVWDIMVTLPDFSNSQIEKLRSLKDVERVTLYQKEEAISMIDEEEQSEELKKLGGFENLSASNQVYVPLIELDDESFISYCTENGIEPNLEGIVLVNRIWDRFHSNFRDKIYIPFLNETSRSLSLSQNKENGQTLDLFISGYSQNVPKLREEYENYALVGIVPLSLKETYPSFFDGEEANSYVCIRAKKGISQEELNRLEEQVKAILGTDQEIKYENRIQEKQSNDRLMQGMVLIFSGFCVLLAIIGLSNLFVNTLGFLQQRKRELAQYISIGLTPKQVKKIFFIEAFVMAGKPIGITIGFTLLFIPLASRASYLDPAIFWSQAPIFPILLFAGAIFGLVGLAYFIGSKRLFQCDLNEILRDDTLI